MIVVVTVFRSNNYGSLLQAKVLGDILSQYDEVRFLDNGKRSFWEWGLVKGVLVAAIKQLKLRKALFLANKLLQNYFGWRKLKTVAKIPQNKDVVIVLGSDEIWNVTKANCDFAEFWGEGLSGKLISYAPSTNNSTLDALKSREFVERNLQRMSCISVRDAHSRQLITNLTKKNIELVLDPTMLKPLEYYVNEKKFFPKVDRYIAVYVFDSRITQDERKSLKQYASTKGLKLVSVGGWNDWCDCSLPAINQNPFLHYINAEYVVANTFHGTAFAINFHKQFVTYGRKSNKITELINMFHLEDRNVSELDPNALNSIMSKKINYREVDDLLKKYRNESLNFIKRSLSTETD